jgi:hypothetical protein
MAPARRVALSFDGKEIAAQTFDKPGALHDADADLASGDVHRRP